MQIKDIAPSFVVASIVAFAVYLIKFIHMSYYIILPIQLIIGLILIIVICSSFNIQEYQECKSILSSFVKRIVNRR